MLSFSHHSFYYLRMNNKTTKTSRQQQPSRRTKTETSAPFKSILDFLRQNIFLTTVMSIILCSLAYLYQILTLQKWNIPIGSVNGMQTQFLFTVVVSLLYCFTYTYTQEYIRKQFEMYVPTYLVYKFGTKMMRKVAKFSMIEENKKLEKGIRKTILEGKSSKNNILRTMLFAILLSMMIFLPFFMLYFITILGISALATLILFAVSIIFIISLEFFTSGREIRRKIRQYTKQLRNDKNNPLSYTCAYNKLANEELKRLLKLKKGNHTSYKYIATTSVVSILLFVTYMLLHLYYFTKSDYWIYTDTDGTKYVSVFEAGENTILKRAETNNDTITIYLNDQIYINATDKLIHYNHFSDVVVKN